MESDPTPLGSEAESRPRRLRVDWLVALAVVALLVLFGGLGSANGRGMSHAVRTRSVTPVSATARFFHLGRIKGASAGPSTRLARETRAHHAMMGDNCGVFGRM